MPGFLFHVGASAICSHAGTVQVISSNTRVLVSGMPVATFTDTALIAGCTFLITTPAPQPCIKVQWLTPAARVTINGQPALLQTSVGLGIGPTQAPQGPITIVSTQPRVMGS